MYLPPLLLGLNMPGGKGTIYDRKKPSRKLYFMHASAYRQLFLISS